MLRLNIWLLNRSPRDRAEIRNQEKYRLASVLQTFGMPSALCCRVSPQDAGFRRALPEHKKWNEDKTPQRV